MKKVLRISIAVVLLIMSVVFAQASDSKVYSGANIVIAAGASYELTPDTDGVIAGTLQITSSKAGYWVQGCNPGGATWTTMIFYGPKSLSTIVANNGTRVKNVLSTPITISYTLTCIVTYSPFVAMDVDDARHTDSDLNYEWWYFDANFDNGYSTTVVFYGADTKFVECAIYDPSGSKVTSDWVFDTWSASTEQCDVWIGTNHFWGSYPDWHIEYMHNGTGVDLDMHSLVEGWRDALGLDPTGRTILTIDPFTYMGWVIAQPRAAVTGTISINGSTMNVTGTSYHDHNWGNTPLHDQYDHWYWGRIFLPDYTMVFSVGNLNQELGYGTNNIFLTFKNKTFVGENLGVTAAFSNIVNDPTTGYDYPQTITYTLPILGNIGTFVTGTFTQNLTQLIESVPLPELDGGPNGAYFRFLQNGVIDLTVGTDHIQVTQPLLSELMIP